MLDFQYIYDLVSDYLPNEWSRLVIYISIHEELSEVNFFYKCNNKYICVFEDANVDAGLFENLNEIIEIVRDSRRESDAWRTCSISICNNGDFNAEYDDSIDFMDAHFLTEWQAKYFV